MLRIFLITIFAAILASACELHVPAGVPVVPFSEGPKPEGVGSGWSCYEYRSSGGKTGSACERAVEDCRKSATEKSEENSGSGSFATSYTAGGCAEQKEAFCSYRWTEERYAKAHPSRNECFRTMNDCKWAQAHLHDDDGIAKQSECSEYD